MVANGLIYFNADQLYALNATTGALVWSYPVLGDVATANGYVYIGADKLYALNATALARFACREMQPHVGCCSRLSG